MPGQATPKTRKLSRRAGTVIVFFFAVVPAIIWTVGKFGVGTGLGTVELLSLVGGGCGVGWFVYSGRAGELGAVVVDRFAKSTPPEPPAE